MLLNPHVGLSRGYALTFVLALALVFAQRVCAAQALSVTMRFHLTHAAMGTEFTIDLYANDQSTAEQVSTAAFDEIDRLEDLLSNYRPSSELSRCRQRAGRHRSRSRKYRQRFRGGQR